MNNEKGVLRPINNDDDCREYAMVKGNGVWVNAGHGSVYIQELSDGSVRVQIMARDSSIGSVVGEAFADAADLVTDRELAYG